MTYLFLYLAVGVVFYLVVFISHQLREHPESNPVLGLTKKAKEVISSLCRVRITSWDSLTDIVVVPLLGKTTLLAVWPVVLLVMTKEELLPHIFSQKIPEKVFSVANTDLQCQMTIEEIEQHEHVTDPMGAVPDLPFGHLNAAWSQFKGNLEPHDSVWSFTAQWTASWGSRQIREGYVIVRADNIGPHFLTSLRWLKDEVKSGSEAPILDFPTFLKKQR